MLVQADGHVILVGEDFSGTLVNNYFTRFDSSGNVDIGGFSTTLTGSLNHAKEAPGLSGAFYLGGAGSYGGTGSNLNRVSATGALDATFSTSIDNFFSALEVMDDGTIYVGGQFLNVNGTARTRIARILPTGATDPAFTPLGGFNAQPLVILKRGDGSGDIYVGGSFTTYRGAGAPYLIRLHSDGSPDPTFNVGVGPSFSVEELAEDSEGNLYIGGQFASYQSTSQTYFAKLRPDGSRHPDFPTGTIFDGRVRAIFIAKDGSEDVYVGGQFTTYRGTLSHHLVRMTPNGELE